MWKRILTGVVLALLPAMALAQSSAGSSGGGGGGGGTGYYAGQYNSPLASFANGQAGYLSLDQNARLMLAPSGLGAMTATPACSTNGTPLAGSPPPGKRGARLYVPPGGSISFTVAGAQPSSAPVSVTVANPSANTVPANWDEDLAGTQMVYCTASSGAPLFRWY